MSLAVSYIREDKTLTSSKVDELIRKHDILMLFSYHLDSQTGDFSSSNDINVPMAKDSNGYKLSTRIATLRNREGLRTRLMFTFVIDTPEPNNPGQYITDCLNDPIRCQTMISKITSILKAQIKQTKVCDGVAFDFEGSANMWASIFPAFVNKLRAELVRLNLPSYINGYLSTRYYGLPNVWPNWEASLDHVILPIYSTPDTNYATPTDTYTTFTPRLTAIESQITNKSKLLYIEGVFGYDSRAISGGPRAQLIAPNARSTIFYTDILSKNYPITGSIPELYCNYYSRLMTDAEILTDPICQKFNVTTGPVYQQIYWSTPEQFRLRFAEKRAIGYGGFGYWYGGVEYDSRYLDILKFS